MWLLVPSTKQGWMPGCPNQQLMGADWYSVWGLLGLSELSVGKVRQLGECIELQ